MKLGHVKVAPKSTHCIMAGRVHEIFGTGSLQTQVQALNQLATDVFEARADPVQLTRALPIIFQQIFCGVEGSTYVAHLYLQA